MLENGADFLLGIKYEDSPEYREQLKTIQKRGC